MDLHPLDPRASPTRRIISAPGAAVDAIPPPRAGHGASQAGRNSPATAWCGGPGTWTSTPARSRPYRKNDQATIESKNNHVVRRYASLLPPRTPTPSARCRAACGSRPGTRVNFLTPTRKPIGWGAGRAGRRKRLYDRPRTPPGRLLDTDAPADAQKDELIDYRNRLNPAVITRRIIELQDVLVRLAKDKTDQHPPRPDPQHPARRPQGHPGQESLPGRPRSRGQFHVRHRRSFAGTLT